MLYFFNVRGATMEKKFTAWVSYRVGFGPNGEPLLIDPLFMLTLPPAL